MGLKPRRRLSHYRFDSAILGNSRDVWVQTGRANPRPYEGLLVFLDAEHYLDDLGAAGIVERLQRQDVVPPLLPVFVSHVDYPTRWRESFCNPDFGAFVSTELIPWLTRIFDVGEQPWNALVGLSLTGLAAVYAGLQHPETLHGVLSQSGSFWWRDGWLIDEVQRHSEPGPALWFSVGLREVDEDVDHGDGLRQRESQLSANRRLRDALAHRQFRHLYREHDGGHDRESFGEDLPCGLQQLRRLREGLGGIRAAMERGHQPGGASAPKSKTAGRS